MNHRRSTLQSVGLACLVALGPVACNDERQGPAAGSGGVSGSSAGGYAGVSAGAGGEFAGSGGFSGSGASTSGLGGTGASGAVGGSGGTAGTGTTTDAGAAMGCPATFECVTDPFFNALSACLPMGGGLPPECMTDADCITAGLPEGLCLSEEETGLTGCLQVCMP